MIGILRVGLGKRVTPNVLKEGSIRCCMRCPEEQKYDGEKWQEIDSGMIVRERYR